MAELSDVYSAAQSLTPQELTALKIMLTRSGAKDSKNPNSDTYKDEDLFYKNLMICFERMRISGKQLPYASFRSLPNTRSTYNSFSEGFSYLNHYFIEYFPTLTGAERVKLYQLSLDILLRELRSNKVVCTIGTVAKNIIRIPELMSREFPGYLESGLACLIVKRYADERPARAGGKLHTS